MKTLSIVLLIFLALTIFTTYPLAFKANTHIPGTFDTTEIFGTIWFGWQSKYAFVNKIDVNNYHFVSYPFGLPAGKGFIFPVGMFIVKWLSVITNEVFMYNFQILTSFLLSGLFTFLLVRYLTKNVFVAIFSGIIYAFCPYHFARVWQHLGLAQIHWLPLYLFALCKLREEKRFKNTIFVTISFFLLYENYTYAYFMVIATIVFMVFIFFQRQQEQKVRIFKLLAISALFTFLLTLPAAYIVYKNYFFGPPKEAMDLYYRLFGDLFPQSARPLSYFLPSSFHPLFGKFTQMFVGSSLYGKNYTEHTIYLGWIPLVFSFIAFRRWRQGRRSQATGFPSTSLRAGSLQLNERFYISFFVFLTIVAWFFSQPPWWQIGKLRIFMPSFFMHKILPMFRAYCRFGIVVMLAVAVLAGYGLKFILEKFKAKRSKVLVACLFCSLVLFEFWNWPPYRVIDVSKAPQVYYWLKEQPGDFAVAEYPLDTDGTNLMYMFYQTKHHKRIINCTIPGTYANKVAKTITRLSDPKAAGVLAWMGVKYAIVHKDGYLRTELIEEIEEVDKIKSSPGLMFFKNFGDIEVYEVIAEPVEPVIN